jgi:hypothetical protein
MIYLVAGRNWGGQRRKLFRITVNNRGVTRERWPLSTVRVRQQDGKFWMPRAETQRMRLKLAQE